MLQIYTHQEAFERLQSSVISYLMLEAQRLFESGLDDPTDNKRFTDLYALIVAARERQDQILADSAVASGNCLVMLDLDAMVTIPD